MSKGNKAFALKIDENKKCLLAHYEDSRHNKLVVNITLEGFKVVYGESEFKVPSNNKNKFETFEELCNYFSIPADTSLWIAEDGETLDKYIVEIENDASDSDNQTDHPATDTTLATDVHETTDEACKSKNEEDRPKNDMHVDEINLSATKAVTKQVAVDTYNSNIAPLNISKDTLKVGAMCIAEEVGKQLDRFKKKDKTPDTDNAEPQDIETSEPYTLDDFNEHVYGVNANILKNILRIKKALILVSPPGTGKTTTAIELAKYITGETNSDRVKLVSFSETTSYSDIIGGYKKNSCGDWSIEKGSLFKICDRALGDPDNIYIYIIDEINRANTQAVLGEAITAMSKRGQKVSTNIDKTLDMPSNLYIIATMNTTDNSLISLDQAMLDRFAIYDMLADGSVGLRADDKSSKQKLVFDKPDLDEYTLACAEYIAEYISEINDILGKDKFKHEDNKIGLRALYTDYKSIGDLDFVLEFDIVPKVKARMHNLDDDDKRKIDEILNSLSEALLDEINNENWRKHNKKD